MLNLDSDWLYLLLLRAYRVLSGNNLQKVFDYAGWNLFVLYTLNVYNLWLIYIYS